MTKIFLTILLVLNISCAYSQEFKQIIEEQQLSNFLESAKTASSKATGFIEESRSIFIKGAVLPENYKELMFSYQVNEDEDKVYYTFLDSQGDYGAYWVKLVVNVKDRTVDNLDAMGKTYMRK